MRVSPESNTQKDTAQAPHLTVNLKSPGLSSASWPGEKDGAAGPGLRLQNFPRLSGFGAGETVHCTRFSLAGNASPEVGSLLGGPPSS